MTASRFRSPRSIRALGASLAAAALGAAALAGCGSSSSHTTRSGLSTPTKSSPAGFTSRPITTGVTIMHATPSGKVSVTQPDDITKLGTHIFVAFQNGVGPQGEPVAKFSPGAGNRDSTIVELSTAGSPVRQWDIVGHADGLTADPTTGRVIATVNEDANPLLYVIDPASHAAVQYRFPPLPSHGGVDAVSVWHGMLLASASAPGTSGQAPPQPAYPAVYVVSLDSSTHMASVRPLFGEEATAKRVNSGASASSRLALTDPDSNAVVPAYVPRFGGQFELTSQGDDEQIFVADSAGKQLSVLKTARSIDDSAWASGPSGTLYVADGGADLIYKVTGPFKQGAELVGVTPCDAGNAPMSCPAPGFPANYLGQVDPSTGAISKLDVGYKMSPAGLLFVP